jgi:hypothetical protein
MDCGYCGHRIPPGAMDCPRCGGPAVARPSSPPGAEGAQPFGPPGAGPIFTSAPTGADLDAAAAAPAPRPRGDDPEAAMLTQLVSGDRQEVLETRVVEPPPAVKEPVAVQPKGLPDSRVARGVEDSLLEVKRFVFRLGGLGRLAFFSHCVVIVGAVCPWFYVAHQGFTPGIEQWGWLPLVLSAAALGTLLWRFRPVPKARVLPVLLHLALSAGLVLSILWIYRTTMDLPDHVQPHFAPGIYVSAGGAALSAVAALLGIKDVR